ncbi:MAG: lysophospholipid acyltransferase family protein [candidate division KSB1 bacterium]
MNEKWFRPSDLYWPVVWLCGKMFYAVAPVPLLFLWANLKGWYKSLTSPQRTAAYNNLFAVFGDVKSEREIRALVRRHFQYAEKNELTYLLPRLPVFARPERWPVEGLEHLEAALAAGKGAILLSAHYGYARMIKPILSMRGYKVSIVGPKAGIRYSRRYKQEREQKRSEFTRFGKFMHQRLQVARDSYDVIDLAATLNIRPLVQVLKRNEILFIQGDGLHAANLVNVEILGQSIPFPQGIMSIARGTGAAVVPVFAVDTPGNLGLRIVIETPICFGEDVAAAPDTAAAHIEKFARVFESYVKRYPHLYRWTREKWMEKRRERGKRTVQERYSELHSGAAMNPDQV